MDFEGFEDWRMVNEIEFVEGKGNLRKLKERRKEKRRIVPLGEASGFLDFEGLRIEIGFVEGRTRESVAVSGGSRRGGLTQELVRKRGDVERCW